MDFRFDKTLDRSMMCGINIINQFTVIVSMVIGIPIGGHETKFRMCEIKS
ncbi:MAG: hypothetical protein ACM3Q2_19035 [Syntrophothermus sp.]